jgi:AcrR family transcriptional regulator
MSNESNRAVNSVVEMQRKAAAPMSTDVTKEVPNKEAKVRRSNVERSATTRSKLINAAIDLLYREGYSATTTISVAAKARVSRGAMLHQFPSRVALLLAVAEFIAAEQSRFRSENMNTQKDATPAERLQAAAKVSWEMHSHPAAMALLEIIMATRSDEPLRQGFAPFAKIWRERRREAAVQMAAELGIDDVTQIDALLGLQAASLSGMAIERMFVQDSAHIDRQRKLLVDFNSEYVQKLTSKKP